MRRMKFKKLTESILKGLNESDEIKSYTNEGIVDKIKNTKNTVLSDGSYHIHGDLDLSKRKLKSLLDLPIRISKVDGYFHCWNNKLTSLEGAPEKVGGDFICSNNKLTSLKGAPNEVGGDFNCSFNKLISLEGAPKEVGGYFSCYNNELTNLEGAPKKVGRDFLCNKNK
jgi:hypothetical protein